MAAILAALMALYIQLGGVSSAVPLTLPETTRAEYEPLVSFTYGTKTLSASLATTSETRTKGLSNTTMLPPDVAKVFVFDRSEPWSFWMKDMQYAIDIIWVDEAGTIVHIEPNVSPDTYPKTFTPPAPARLVIETVPGVSASAGITVGDEISVTPFLQ